jgi:pimeloyl-ACP methyl ester carboxylesterase
MKSDQTNFDKTFSHHTAKVNGVKIHYVTGGAGEPLVLLHGFPTTWQEWKPVMPALAKKYTLIVPDLRGLGDSEITAGGYDSLTTRRRHPRARQIARLYGRRERRRARHRGQRGLRLRRNLPAEVKRLVIIDGLPAGINPPVVPGTEQKSYWHLGFQSIPDFPEIIVAGKERAYFNYFFKTYAFNQAAVTEAEIDEYARAYARPGRLRAFSIITGRRRRTAQRTGSWRKQNFRCPSWRSAAKPSAATRFCWQCKRRRQT